MRRHAGHEIGRPRAVPRGIRRIDPLPEGVVHPAGVAMRERGRVRVNTPVGAPERLDQDQEPGYWRRDQEIRALRRSLERTPTAFQPLGPFRGIVWSRLDVAPRRIGGTDARGGRQEHDSEL